MIVVYIFALAAAIAVGMGLMGLAQRKNNTQLISADALHALRKRDSIAEDALLEIGGNTAGNPVATAQAALADRRAVNNQSKELY